MIGIYKITNKLTNQCYIGQSIDINHRLGEHKRCEGFSYIHNAIKKYGLENFTFEVVEQTTKDKLNEREIFWIAYYDSYNNGYNMTLGGDNMSDHPCKAVDQYDLQGNYIKTFNSVGDASRETGAASGKICAVCKQSRRTAANFQWRYHGDTPPGKAKTKNRPIDQYSLDWEFIRTWESAAEAGRFYNKDYTAIQHVCAGIRPTAWGYKWKYHE